MTHVRNGPRPPRRTAGAGTAGRRAALLKRASDNLEQRR